MSDDKRVMLTGEALDAFGHLTSMFIDACDQIAATDGNSMKVLVVAIPFKEDGPRDEHNNQMTQMQVISNIDHREVQDVLDQVSKTVKIASEKGVTKRTVVFVPPSGGEPN